MNTHERQHTWKGLRMGQHTAFGLVLEDFHGFVLVACSGLSSCIFIYGRGRSCAIMDRRHHNIVLVWHRYGGIITEAGRHFALSFSTTNNNNNYYY